MKLHEFMFTLSNLVQDFPEIMDYDVVTHETILGFMENVEKVTIDNDSFTENPVVAIQFRNQ